MKVKKVCLTAYATGNLGDDLFIKLICDRYPNTQFFIYSWKEYSFYYKNIKNLTFVSFNENIFSKIAYRISEALKIELPYFSYPILADAHVKIGGSMFMQTPNWEENYKHHFSFIKNFKKNYIMGANFGPYHSEDFLEKYKSYFKLFDDICFRDTASKNLFTDLPNVRQADDIVFQLEHDAKKVENYYVVSPIHCASRSNLKEYHNAYMDKLAEVINKITSKGSNVTLMGFCKTEKDDIAIDELYEKLENKEKINKYNHDSIEKSLDMIANSKGIIATRFHAMILGLNFSKPTIPLLYSDKMRTVLEDMKYPNIYYDLKLAAEINAEDLIDKLENQTIFDINAIKENSAQHFQELDKLLLGE